jgi:hypothetical protein
MAAAPSSVAYRMTLRIVHLTALAPVLSPGGCPNAMTGSASCVFDHSAPMTAA